jgi:hypothetical protein
MTPPSLQPTIIDDRLTERGALVYLMTEEERQAFFESGGDVIPDRLKDVDTGKLRPAPNSDETA